MEIAELIEHFARPLRDDGVIRADNWTALVREDSTKDRWWAHILWYGMGYTEIGFQTQDGAISWVIGKLYELKRDSA